MTDTAVIHIFSHVTDTNAVIPADLTGTLLTARYGENHEPDPKGVYEVRVLWTPEASGAGTLVRGLIEVYEGTNGGDTAPVYTLETASFKPEVMP